MTKTQTLSSREIAQHIVRTVNEARKIGSDRPLLDGADGGTTLGALTTESRAFSEKVDILVGRGDIKVQPHTGWREYWLQIQAIAD